MRPLAGGSVYGAHVGYPQSILGPGERVVVHHHPHVKRLVAPVLGFLVISMLAGVAAGLVSGSSLASTTRGVLWLVIVGIWLLCAVFGFVRPLLSWRSTHFVVTDRRVAARSGVFSRSGIDVPIARITWVELRQSVIDRMLRNGTIVVESSAADRLEFRDIPDARRVHGLLHREVLEGPADAAHGGDGMFGGPTPQQPFDVGGDPGRPGERW
ncbi:PH domain-containing protein [Gordonia jinhuaensis]|uniref:YdbS-like PH domain-containing protein n=1 Tax=Gordonia jinhuaensis TaxID=1517702 RepID=A0A916WML3_9ACTN|nr:hypothetical protein GCM10011489_00880 [Gordonia jinhuaensis]